MMLTPEQIQEETTMNKEALALLQTEDFSKWSEPELQNVVDQMQIQYNTFNPLGYNCLGIIALRNKASQLIRSKKFQVMGIA